MYRLRIAFLAPALGLTIFASPSHALSPGLAVYVCDQTWYNKGMTIETGVVSFDETVVGKQAFLVDFNRRKVYRKYTAQLFIDRNILSYREIAGSLLQFDENQIIYCDDPNQCRGAKSVNDNFDGMTTVGPWMLDLRSGRMSSQTDSIWTSRSGPSTTIKIWKGTRGTCSRDDTYLF